MEKTKVNYFIDVLLVISFVLVGISGLILFFVPYAPKGEVFILGLDRYLWSSIHNISGLSFIALGVLHFILHLEWMKTTTKWLFEKEEQEETKKL